MNWVRLILIVLASLTALSAAALAWLVYADLAFLKPRIETYVREVTQRDFAISGPFSLEFGWQITATAQGISLGNSDWGEVTNMAEIEQARVEVDVGSLLDGPVVINLVEISGARVYLEEDPHGRTNWVLGAADSDADSDAEEDDWIVPRVVSIENVTITYAAPQLNRTLKAHIASLRQTHAPADDHLEAVVSASINDRQIEISTDIGPFENLLAGRQFEYNATGRFDTLSVATSGFIDDLRTPALPALALSINGQNVDDLTTMLGLADYGEGALTLDARLTPTDGSLALSVQGDLAGLRIKADGSASDLRTLSEATFYIDASGPHLGRFLNVFGIEDVPDVAFKAAGGLTRSTAGLRLDAIAVDLGQTSLRMDGHIAGFPDLDAADLQFTLKGPELAAFKRLLNLPDSVTGAFDLRGSVTSDDDGADVVQFTMATPLVNFNLEGPLGNPPDYSGTRLRFAGAGENLAAVSDRYADLNPSLVDLIPDKPFAATGTVSVEKSDFHLKDARASVANAEVLLTGNLSRDVDYIGSRISFTASGADLEDLIADAAQVDIQPTEFEISGAIERLLDTLRIDEVQIIGAAGSRIRLDVDLGWPLTDSATAEFVLEVAGPDATALPIQIEAFDPGALPFDLKARGNLRRGRLTFDSVHTRLGEADLSWSGVYSAPDFSATDLQLSVNFPDLSALGAFDDEPLPELPFSLDAHFDGTVRTFVMDQMQGSLGGTTFHGKLDVDVSDSVPIVNAQLDFPVLDLRDWMDDVETEAPAAAEDAPATQVQRATGVVPAKADSDQRVIPDHKLPLDQLTRFDGSMTVSAGEVLMRTVTFTNALVSAEIAAGSLRVSELDIMAPSGRFDGTLSVQPVRSPAGDSVASNDTADEKADVHFTLKGKDLQLNLTGENADDLATAPIYDLDIDLAGHGATTREIAATLSGTGRLLSDGGRIRNAGLSVLLGGFSRNLFGTLNPFSKRDSYTDIICVVATFAATDGTVKTTPHIMLQSRKMDLMSEGSIDLASENIKMGFRSRSRKGFGDLINPYIRVRGTLDTPRLSIGKSGTALTGGAAAITGGLSILAQAALDRTFRAKDPCGKALAEARAGQTK